MSLSKNKAVRKAYETGEYTDNVGVTWRKGMDGWFDDSYGPNAVFLARHHDFVEMIEKEHPEDGREAALHDTPPLTVILVEESEGKA